MKEVETKFNFSYDYLRSKVGNVVGFMNRDVTEFNNRGVTLSDVDDFKAQGDEFETFSPNSYYQLFVSQEVEAKNKARASCILQARKMVAIVEQVYGNKSGVYKGLRYNNVAGAKDDSFITLIRNIAKICESFLTNLTSAGMNQTIIDTLRTTAQTMEDKFHAIAIKEAERDDATEERINLANALYNNLSKYCKIGKSIWEDVSEAKYNDYVINPIIHHGLSKVRNFTAEIMPDDPMSVSMNWDAVVDATDYELYQSQVNLNSAAGEFTLHELVPVNNYILQLMPGFTYYWKVRAKNNDSHGTFSDDASLTVFNIN